MGKKIRIKVDNRIKELVPDFLENRKKNVKVILESLDKKDFEAIELMGHRLRGVGRTYRFNTISDIGGSIEEAAKYKDEEKIRKYCIEILEYLDSVEVVS
jgi:hypothetical protein